MLVPPQDDPEGGVADLKSGAPGADASGAAYQDY